MSAAAATSDSRATEAAVAALRSGGNAVDAAVTAAFVLYVVEPQSCGIGGDGFMLIHEGTGPPTALDGSGAVPADLTPDALSRRGLTTVPARGALTVTPPGAISLLARALLDLGTISLADAVEPARRLARDGFTVRPSLAGAAASAAKTSPDVIADPVLGPLYWPGGTPVAVDDTILNPALADALEVVRLEGADAITHGPLGAAIVEAVQAAGGVLTDADLTDHSTQRVAPASVPFAGHVMWQMPAPTQGPAVLAALREIPDSPPIDWNLVYFAMAAAMNEAGFDPAAVRVGSPSPAKGDTTYLAVVDHDGMAVSLITSVFGDFGSHLGVPALGGPIHNRATTFRLSNRLLGPGKPPHTTIPGLITDADGRFRCALGVAGGIMQPQTQVQLTLRTLLEGDNPQEAIDRPRFKICFGGALALEPGHPLEADHPEALHQNPGPEGFGAAQMVGWHRGALLAGADPRRGGHAIVVD